jgi:hypothetical protein
MTTPGRVWTQLKRGGSHTITFVMPSLLPSCHPGAGDSAKSSSHKRSIVQRPDFTPESPYRLSQRSLRHPTRRLVHREFRSACLQAYRHPPTHIIIKVQIEEKLRPGFAAPQGSVASGTVSSNPACSSSESVSAVDRRALPEEPRGFAALGACTGREKRRAGRNSAPLYPFSLTGIDAVPPRTTGQAAVNRGL